MVIKQASRIPNNFETKNSLECFGARYHPKNNPDQLDIIHPFPQTLSLLSLTEQNKIIKSGTFYAGWPYQTSVRKEKKSAEKG